MTATTYKAACSCGNIHYDYTSAVAPEDWPVRTCGCAFCSKRPNHLHCADPKGHVRFSYTDPDQVTTLRHGTNTADFIICAKCDGYMGAIMPTDHGRFSVLNLEHLIDQLPLKQPERLKWAEETVETRLARRSKSWMPVVD